MSEAGSVCDQYGLSKGQTDIFDLLNKTGHPLRIVQLAKRLGRGYRETESALHRMKQVGLVYRTGHGRYAVHPNAEQALKDLYTNALMEPTGNGLNRRPVEDLRPDEGRMPDRATIPVPAPDPVELNELSDVLTVLEETLNQARQLPNSVSRNRAIAQLINVTLKALELGPISKRLAALEEKVKKLAAT